MKKSEDYLSALLYNLQSNALSLKFDENVWSYEESLFRREPPGEKEDYLDAVYMSISEIQSEA